MLRQNILIQPVIPLPQFFKGSAVFLRFSLLLLPESDHLQKKSGHLPEVFPKRLRRAAFPGHFLHPAAGQFQPFL